MKVCSVCGKEMIVLYNGHEGGLGETWICPIHSTRGKVVVFEPEPPVRLRVPTGDFLDAA